MQRIRFVRSLALVIALFGIVLSAAFAAPRASVDLNTGWQFRQRMPSTGYCKANIPPPWVANWRRYHANILLPRRIQFRFETREGKRAYSTGEQPR
jgi:hypothetical protein